MEKRKIVPIWTTLGYRELIEGYKYTFDMVTIPDYGGVGVDLKANDIDNEVECVKIKIENENHFLGFQAKTYCLPFTKPNEINYLSDPCLKIIDRYLENQSTFCTKLSNYRNFSRNTKTQPLIIKAYETLKKLLDETAISEEQQHEIYIPKQFTDLLKLYPEPFPTLNSNWLYTGGCLTSVDDKILLHSCGERFENLVSTTLEEKEDSDKIFNVKNQSTLNINDGSKIHQIVYQETLKRRFCAIRKKCHCDIFSVTENDETLDYKLLKRNYSNELLSSVAISPHIPGEILTSNNMGYIQLQSLISNKLIWKTEDDILHEKVSDTSNDWWVIDFGPHPRSLFYLDRTNFMKADLRSKDFKSQTLLSSNNQYIHGEDLMLFKGNLLNPLQYFVATSYHLTLIDERFAQKPLHIWNHHLQSPPLYWSQTLIENENQFVFLLSSQNSKETSCLQLDSKTEGIQPISLGSMWHLSSPGDFVKVLNLQGASLSPEIETRTSLPLIGVQVVSRKKKSGFTAFQLTSVGDLYYQDYFPQSTRGERNYHYGAGCEFLDEKDILAKYSDWFKEAHKESRPNNEDKSVIETEININNLVDKMEAGPSSSDSCAVCSNSNNPNPSKNEICPGCGCNEIIAFNILKAKEEGGIISKFMLQETDQQENTEKDKLNLIDLDRHFDPFSQKLLSMWIGNDKSQLSGPESQDEREDEEAEIFASILQPKVSFYVKEENEISMVPPGPTQRDNLPTVQTIVSEVPVYSQDTPSQSQHESADVDADWFFQSPKVNKSKTKMGSSKKNYSVGF